MAPAPVVPPYKEIIAKDIDEHFAKEGDLKLPYSAATKEAIKAHWVEAGNKFRGLDIHVEDYFETGEPIMYLFGPLPMYYKNPLKNDTPERCVIRSKIFFGKNYPVEAPKILLHTDLEYCVHPNNPRADKESEEYTSDYQKNWGPSSNILELCVELGKEWSELLPVVRIGSLTEPNCWGYKSTTFGEPAYRLDPDWQEPEPYIPGLFGKDKSEMVNPPKDIVERYGWPAPHANDDVYPPRLEEKEA